MSRTVFFQMARGRAMVRSRCMRRARSLTDSLRIGTYRGAPVSARDRVQLTATVRILVGRARAAHREWRRYRALDAVCLTGVQ